MADGCSVPVDSFLKRQNHHHSPPDHHSFLWCEQATIVMNPVAFIIPVLIFFSSDFCCLWCVSLFTVKRYGSLLKVALWLTVNWQGHHNGIQNCGATQQQVAYKSGKRHGLRRGDCGRWKRHHNAMKDKGVRIESTKGLIFSHCFELWQENDLLTNAGISNSYNEWRERQVVSHHLDMIIGSKEWNGLKQPICWLKTQSTKTTLLWTLHDNSSGMNSTFLWKENDRLWLTVIKFPPSALSSRIIVQPRFWPLLILLISLPDPSTLPSDTIGFVLTLVSRMVMASSSRT